MFFFPEFISWHPEAEWKLGRISAHMSAYIHLHAFVHIFKFLKFYLSICLLDCPYLVIAFGCAETKAKAKQDLQKLRAMQSF